MSSLWLPEVAIWEKVLRSLVVYVLLLVALRDGQGVPVE